MILSLKSDKSLRVLRLVFDAAPVCTFLYMLLAIVHAVMPTAATALATANFVNTATAILQESRPLDAIYLPLILLVLVLCAFTTIGAVMQLVKAKINANLQRKLKPEIVRMHAALDFKHIENAESWELISRVSRDPVKSLMDGFGAYTQFIQIIISIASVLGLILTQVWWAAFIIAAFSVPMFWLSMRAGKKNYQAGRDAERFNRRTEYLGEVLTERSAVDERTLFGYSEYVNKSWLEQYEAGRILQRKVTARMFLITKGSSMILALTALLITLVLINPVIMGRLTTGMFMGIVSAVFGLIQQLGWQMSSSLEKISRVREYEKDLVSFTALSKSEGAYDLPDHDPPELKTIEMKNVRFKYPNGDRYILDGLSLTLQQGGHYAFVGRNGAGKTTITKLLTGLYTDYEGEILINGKELRTYPASTLKALSSVVYQDFSKYGISLKDNIMLGDIEETAGSRVTEIAALAGLDKIIAELKNGVDTPLGKVLEGGQDISGGEWQRVAIARSLISRAPLKILDEPTAALDPISESRIYREFEKLMQGKTTIFISHRLGSIKLADEIMVIEGGKVMERGTHDQLMKANGQYMQMYEMQRSWYR